jgi:hypothetical protein
MDSRSFNLSITNLFIGLLTGSRFLRPYSQVILNFAYKIIGAETTLTTHDGRSVTPELLAASETRRQIIQTEWTTVPELTFPKQEQINKLLEIDIESLSQYLACLDSPEVGVSTLLVVLPDAATKYSALITQENEARLMLCGFTYNVTNSVFHLSWHMGKLQDIAFSSLLEQDISVDRIPYDYTYHLIDELEDKNKILKLVIDELVAFCLQGRDEFTPEEIAQGIYGSIDIWNALASDKKRHVIKNVNSVFRHFKKMIARNSLIKTGTDDSISWRINVSPKKLRDLSSDYLKQNMTDGKIVFKGNISDWS